MSATKPKHLAHWWRRLFALWIQDGPNDYQGRHRAEPEDDDA